MYTEKIYDENGKSFTRVFAYDKVERVNPIVFYREHEIKKRIIILKDTILAKDPMLSVIISDAHITKYVKGTISEFFDEFEKTEVKDNFVQLLQAERKKDQVRLLKGVSIDHEELMALIFKSYRDFGFLYSKYLFENLPKSIQGKKLPKMFNINKDGSISKVGETDLSDGELKNVILHRKAIASHFFEKDNVWHCFFITYNSIGGKENYKEGQAHFHYISSAFGITKEAFIESMKTGNYLSTSIHIDLLGYGHQANSEEE